LHINLLIYVEFCCTHLNQLLTIVQCSYLENCLFWKRIFYMTNFLIVFTFLRTIAWVICQRSRQERSARAGARSQWCRKSTPIYISALTVHAIITSGGSGNVSAGQRGWTKCLWNGGREEGEQVVKKQGGADVVANHNENNYLQRLLVSLKIDNQFRAKVACWPSWRSWRQAGQASIWLWRCWPMWIWDTICRYSNKMELCWYGKKLLTV